MSLKLPPQIETDLANEGIESLKSGRAVRRSHMLLHGLILGALLAALAAFGISDGFVIAVTVAGSSLCVIYAMMSVLASLCVQLDLLDKIIVYYGEREDR